MIGAPKRTSRRLYPSARHIRDEVSGLPSSSIGQGLRWCPGLRDMISRYFTILRRIHKWDNLFQPRFRLSKSCSIKCWVPRRRVESSTVSVAVITRVRQDCSKKRSLAVGWHLWSERRVWAPRLNRRFESDVGAVNVIIKGLQYICALQRTCADSTLLLRSRLSWVCRFIVGAN